ETVAAAKPTAQRHMCTRDIFLVRPATLLTTDYSLMLREIVRRDPRISPDHDHTRPSTHIKSVPEVEQSDAALRRFRRCRQVLESPNACEFMGCGSAFDGFCRSRVRLFCAAGRTSKTPRGDMESSRAAEGHEG